MRPLRRKTSSPHCSTSGSSFDRGVVRRRIDAERNFKVGRQGGRVTFLPKLRVVVVLHAIAPRPKANQPLVDLAQRAGQGVVAIGQRHQRGERVFVMLGELFVRQVARRGRHAAAGGVHPAVQVGQHAMQQAAAGEVVGLQADFREWRNPQHAFREELERARGISLQMAGAPEMFWPEPRGQHRAGGVGAEQALERSKRQAIGPLLGEP